MGLRRGPSLDFREHLWGRAPPGRASAPLRGQGAPWWARGGLPDSAEEPHFLLQTRLQTGAPGKLQAAEVLS